MAHRTALIAAGSIAIVIVAAAVAVGANLGILDVADSRPVGQLSATGPATGMQIADASPAETPAPTPQKYVIKKVGTVSVTAGASGVRLADVTAKHGWRWALAQTKDSRLTVTFTSGRRTYTFVALLGPHQTIRARVDHPVTKVLPSAPARTTIIAASASPAATPAAAPAASPSAHAAESDDGGSQGGSYGGGGADD